MPKTTNIKDIQIFNYLTDNRIRTWKDENEGVWFVAKDVCSILDIQNHKEAIKVLDDDEKMGVGISDPHGRVQITNIISESGLYALVFRSNKPEARKFRKWVTSEVLPSIRKTGRYDVSRSVKIDPLMNMHILSDWLAMTMPDNITEINFGITLRKKSK